jgi:hypothetical protein
MMRGALLMAVMLSLGGCASWPESGRGGLAERRVVEDSRLESLARRFEGQRVRGAELHAAGLSSEVRTHLIRAQRNHSAGIYDDFELDLLHIARLLDAIDRYLPRKS